MVFTTGQRRDITCPFLDAFTQSSYNKGADLFQDAIKPLILMLSTAGATR